MVSWVVHDGGEMGRKRQRLTLLPGALAICRLEKNAPVPEWALAGPFCSVTLTREELSIVCPETRVPRAVKKEAGWRALQVAGPLDFSLTGVLASLTAPLAREKISVFAVSTYDTDYLLVKEEQVERAIRALREEEYTVQCTRLKVQGSRNKEKLKGLKAKGKGQKAKG